MAVVNRSSGRGRIRSTSKVRGESIPAMSMGLVRMRSWGLILLSGPRTKTLEGRSLDLVDFEPVLRFAHQNGLDFHQDFRAPLDLETDLVREDADGLGSGRNGDNIRIQGIVFLVDARPRQVQDRLDVGRSHLSQQSIRRPDGDVDRGRRAFGDLELSWKIPRLERDLERFLGGNLFLRHQGDPEEDGHKKGEKLEKPVPQEIVPDRSFHFFKYSIRRSSSRFRSARRSRSPPIAREMPPDSSETMITAASVSWVSPMAAR